MTSPFDKKIETLLIDWMDDESNGHDITMQNQHEDLSPYSLSDSIIDTFIMDGLLRDLVYQDVEKDNIRIKNLMDRVKKIDSEQVEFIKDQHDTSDQYIDEIAEIASIIERTFVEPREHMVNSHENTANNSKKNNNWTTKSILPHHSLSSKNVVIPKILVYSSVAAVLVLLLMILSTNANKNVPLIQPQAKNYLPPLMQFASIINENNAVWEGLDSHTEMNQPLFNKPIHLLNGFAKLQFNNDAEVVIEGPAVIEPISGNTLRLIKGKIVVHCKTLKSHGFTVLTSNSKIIDLGTEFGVKATSNSSVVDVYKGEVELKNVNGKKVENLVSNQGAEIHYNGPVYLRDAQPSNAYYRNWDDVIYRPEIQDQAIVVDAEDFNQKDNYDSDTHMSVVYEKRNVKLNHDLSVAIDKAGKFRHFDRDNRFVAKDSVCDSYLIQFRPKTDFGKGNRIASAILKFKRPILGVAAINNQLIESDSIFGLDTIKYNTVQSLLGRGLETVSKELILTSDEIELSEDKKTIRIKIRVETQSLDQLRILVASKKSL